MLAPTLAYAGAAGDGGVGGYQALIPLLLMFGVFYFILIRPQQKKQKSHREMLQHLKTGDQVITSGG
ncbi:MAG: preprotein translocase subunit YajC, partial [candidate division NC10 bacterium]|nr:preprotein translocase subunit YajC [candidate division NC10 bacterium]